MQKVWLVVVIAVVACWAYMYRYEPLQTTTTGAVTLFDRWTGRACFANVAQPGVINCDMKGFFDK